MRKILSAVVVAAFLAGALGGMAEAKDMTNMKGLGWFDQAAPIGGIMWFSPKIGVTAGIGFHKVNKEDFDNTNSDTQINVAAGLPIVLAGADDVNFMFRPSVLYRTKQGFMDGEVPAQFEGQQLTGNSFAVRGDLAVELWITSRASVLAGTGVEFVSESPDNIIVNGVTHSYKSRTTFRTHAISATNVGFYYYFMK